MVRLTYKLVISGLVQGVAFRVSLKNVALINAVDGWVKNTDDGNVESLVQGEEKAIQSVIEWARRGPPGAKVSSLKQQKLDAYPMQRGFHVLI